MAQSWKGPLVVGLIVAGVAAILVMNLQTGGGTAPSRPGPLVAGPAAKDPAPAPGGGMGIPEHPIGEETTRNHIQVAAVWLDAMSMDGAATQGGAGLIHLEADVRATGDNPNGFAKDEFVPYLKVTYTLAPAKGGDAIASGELLPMVARDGLHYGATVAMPKPGDYKLTYAIQPPSANGLGRHSDPATGVAKWWDPFEATFDWQVEKPTATVAR